MKFSASATFRFKAAVIASQALLTAERGFEPERLYMMISNMVFRGNCHADVQKVWFRASSDYIVCVAFWREATWYHNNSSSHSFNIDIAIMAGLPALAGRVAEPSGEKTAFLRR